MTYTDYQIKRFRVLRQTLQIMKRGVSGYTAEASSYEKMKEVEHGED